MHDLLCLDSIFQVLASGLDKSKAYDYFNGIHDWIDLKDLKMLLMNSGLPNMGGSWLSLHMRFCWKFVLRIKVYQNERFFLVCISELVFQISTE